MRKINVAIDGPAGAGKSTIAKMVAKSLGVIYLDTGAMYRAVALKAITEGISTKDREKLSRLVRDIDIKIKYAGDEQQIYLDNENVSNKIRTTEVSVGASDVAAIPEVRLRMVDLQRAIAEKNSVVMDGRDIGTYVLPGADLKIFLTASVEARAKRRFQEQIEKGINNLSFEEVIKEIGLRDEKDSGRDFAPLAKAVDAIEIDTTSMSIKEVSKKIMSFIRE